MANIGSPHPWKILEIMNEELPYGLDLIRLEPKAPTPSTCKCFQIGEGWVILLMIWIIYSIVLIYQNGYKGYR